MPEQTGSRAQHKLACSIPCFRCPINVVNSVLVFYLAHAGVMSMYDMRQGFSAGLLYCTALAGVNGK
jgi:hypothetical protein